MTQSRSKPLKLKKCKVCKIQYPPRTSLQKVCSPTCALELNRQNKMKEFDAETRRRKQAIKTRSEWMKDAQKVFNEYIRERDKKKRCISCGTNSAGQWDAGHYRSVGSSPELRFNTYNCHKQCSVCNDHLSGNIVNYRPRLLKKIGQERLEWLEGPHEAKHYTIDDIKRIIKIFREKTKRLRLKR